MDMDVMQLTPQELKIDNTTVTWAVKTTDKSSGTLATSYVNTIPNKNHEFANQQIINTTSGSFISKATLASTSDHISPVLDTARLGVVAVENLINNLTTNEDAKPSGGSALAKYISRRVSLTDGFDASDLAVFLTMNKRAGTNVYVYYKSLSQYDPELFDNRPWTLMTQTTNTNNFSSFVENQLPNLKNRLVKKIAKVKDKVLKIKLKETVNCVEKFCVHESKLLDDKSVVQLLRYYELDKELSKI